MANVQKQFEEFNEEIKLRRFSENATLIEKRDRVLDTLKDGIKRLREEGESIPTYRTFNQGSYEIGVGTKPLDGDYDIDVGVAFELARGDYDPVDVKTWVLKAVDGHTERVELRNSCVTVFYQAKGEALYHVDLAIYADEAHNDQKLYIARGRTGSSEENKSWASSDPQGLTDLINTKFSGDGAHQFRRVIRALKRWKDERFSNSGHAAPRGIALAVAAYHWFEPVTVDVDGKKKPDDLQAMRSLVGAMLNNFSKRLTVKCPADPYDDLCRRMSDLQMDDFKEKLDSLLVALREAADDVDPHTACKTLAKQFGDCFPIPAQKETAKQQGRAITSSGSSG
jgi:hypothetical protein